MTAACPCKWSQSGGMSSKDTQRPSHTSQALIALPTLNQNPAKLPLQGTGRLGEGVYNPSHSTPSPAGENDTSSC